MYIIYREKATCSCGRKFITELPAKGELSLKNRGVAFPSLRVAPTNLQVLSILGHLPMVLGAGHPMPKPQHHIENLARCLPMGLWGLMCHKLSHC